MKNPNAVALGKKSAEARKKKMGAVAFNNHMRKIATKATKIEKSVKTA